MTFLHCFNAAIMFFSKVSIAAISRSKSIPLRPESATLSPPTDVCLSRFWPITKPLSHAHLQSFTPFTSPAETFELSFHREPTASGQRNPPQPQLELIGRNFRQTKIHFLRPPGGTGRRGKKREIGRCVISSSDPQIGWKATDVSGPAAGRSSGGAREAGAAANQRAGGGHLGFVCSRRERSLQMRFSLARAKKQLKGFLLFGSKLSHFFFTLFLPERRFYLTAARGTERQQTPVNARHRYASHLCTPPEYFPAS